MKCLSQSALAYGKTPWPTVTILADHKGGAKNVDCTMEMRVMWRTLVLVAAGIKHHLCKWGMLINKSCRPLHNRYGQPT